MNVITVIDERIRTLLPVYLLTAGMDHKQDPRNRPQGAEFYQFLYVAKGEGIFESPKGSFPITEGMIIFTAKRCPCAYRATTEVFRTGWVAFDGLQVKTILEYLSADDVAVLKSETVKAQIIAAYRRAERNAPAEVLSQSVYQIVVSFFGELNEGKKQPKLLRAKKYVEENYTKDLSVANIANAVGISESLLFRIFRDEEKTTPIDFLRGVRMKKAKELLVGTENLKIAEIAARTGFSDTAYFCKIFKAETGMTPRMYRAWYIL